LFAVCRALAVRVHFLALRRASIDVLLSDYSSAATVDLLANYIVTNRDKVRGSVIQHSKILFGVKSINDYDECPYRITLNPLYDG
jgi:hypothetical protein